MNDLDALLDPLRDGAELSGDLTQVQAERLTARVVSSIDTLIETLPRLYEGRAWLALGFASWEDYCRGRLRGIVFAKTDRPAVVSALSGEGMSNRAVAAALNIDEGTVRNAKKKKAAESDAENSVPDRVRGADGKTYPATKPKSEHEPVADDHELVQTLRRNQMINARSWRRIWQTSPRLLPSSPR